MKVTVNGVPRELPRPTSVAKLLEAEGYDQVAVALNEEFLPKGAYANTTLKEDDAVEIVAPMQGG